MIHIIYDNFQDGRPLPNGLAPKYHQSFWSKDINTYNVLTRFIPLEDTRLGFFPLLLKNSRHEFVNQHTKEVDPLYVNLFPVELNYSDRSLVLENCFSYISDEALNKIRSGHMKLIVYYGFEAFPIHQAHWMHLVERSLGLLQIPSEHVIMVFGCRHLRDNIRRYYEEETPFWNWKCFNWVRFDHFEFEYSHYLQSMLKNSKSRQQEWIEEFNADKNPKKYFLNLNGGGRDHRVYLIKELFRRQLHNKGHISYLKKYEAEGHLNKYIPGFIRNRNERMKFHRDFKLEQMLLDTPLAYNEWHNRGMSRWTYEDSWFSLVSETLAENRSVFITEKSFKPIANLHPFLIWGYQGILADLRSLGYQTFQNWFDESYDLEKDPAKRAEKVLTECERLTSLSSKKWQAIWREMKSTVLHNRELILRRQFGEQVDQMVEEILELGKSPKLTLQDFLGADDLQAGNEPIIQYGRRRLSSYVKDAVDRWL